MKTRSITLLILVCIMCSFHLLVSAEVEASEVKVQLVIPENVDDNENMFEIEKEKPKVDELISSSNDQNSTRERNSLPTTGEIKSNLGFIGLGCVLFSLVVFRRKKY